MLTKRIIPCLDVKDGRVVKGVHFLNLREAGDPVETASLYSSAGADELVFLDITATLEKRKTTLDVVKKTAGQVFIPLTVGGGIRTLEDIRLLLKYGADKVSLNTAAVKNPDLVKKSSDVFGTQCIVVAIDAKKCPKSNVQGLKSKVQKQELRWEVYIKAGTTPTGLDVVEWAKKVERLGAGEILLTSMDRDGTQDGYDLDLNRAVSSAVNIPVIASGGAGSPEHLYQVLSKGKADAALAASIFHYDRYSIKKVKKYLQKKGLAVRI